MQLGTGQRSGAQPAGMVVRVTAGQALGRGGASVVTPVTTEGTGVGAGTRVDVRTGAGGGGDGRVTVRVRVMVDVGGGGGGGAEVVVSTGQGRSYVRTSRLQTETAHCGRRTC